MNVKLITLKIFFILFFALQKSLFAQSKVERIDIASALESNEVVNMTDYF